MKLVQTIFPDTTAQGRPLQSIISYKGINGVVHIEPNFRANTSLGVVSFPNIRSTYLVEIRENRVVNDVTVRCLDQDLGKRYCNKSSKSCPYSNRYTSSQSYVYWPRNKI